MKNTIKITGIKEAISDYRWANRGGDYSAEYGYIMLDCETGKVWTDSFCDLGHSWRTVYHDDCIINLARYAQEHDFGEITIRNARRIAEQAIREYEEQDRKEGIYTPDFYEVCEDDADTIYVVIVRRAWARCNTAASIADAVSESDSTETEIVCDSEEAARRYYNEIEIPDAVYNSSSNNHWEVVAKYLERRFGDDLEEFEVLEEDYSAPCKE